MNNKKIVIATCLVSLVGGLLGLGLLIHYHHQNKPSAKSDEESVPERPSAGAQKKQVAAKERISPKEPQAQKTPSISSLSKTKEVILKADQLPNGDDFPLRLGSKGKRVERLSIWLMRNYGWTGIINNEFDKKTEQLLKRYLKKSQLDEATYNKLRMGQDLYGKS